MSGWLATAIGIAVYDLWQYKNGKDTMSTAWRKWLDHRFGRPVCVMAWGGLTYHLFGPRRKRA